MIGRWINWTEKMSSIITPELLNAMMGRLAYISEQSDSSNRPHTSPSDDRRSITYEVVHQRVFVRAAPNLSAHIIGSKYQGDIVDTAAEFRGWVRMRERVNGKSGWLLVDGHAAGISAPLLQPLPELHTLPNVTDVPPQQSPECVAEDFTSRDKSQRDEEPSAAVLVLSHDEVVELCLIPLPFAELCKLKAVCTLWARVARRVLCSPKWQETALTRMSAADTPAWMPFPSNPLKRRSHSRVRLLLCHWCSS